MRRALRRLGWVAAVLAGLPVAGAALLLAVLNTAPGQRLAARAVGHFSGGDVALSGLSGRFPDALRASRLEMRDTQGVWLTVDGAALDWAPSRLLHGEARIIRLTAADATLARLPTPPGHRPSSGTGLPVPVVIDTLRIGRLTLAAPVAGTAATLTAEGSGRLDSLAAGTADLALHRIGSEGSYRLHAGVTAASVSATLAAEEPAHGVLGTLAGLPDLGALSLHATADGPFSAIAAHATLTAGALTAAADGRVDVPDRSADLDVTAHAPAMAPRPGLAWQAVQAEAHLHGPWTRPHAQGTATIDGLAAAGATLRHLAATLSGDLGQVTLDATAEGLRIPGPAPELFAAAPVRLHADARLDDPARPVTFALTHTLLSITGAARTAEAARVQAHLDLPDLAPFAAFGAPGLQGRAALDITATPLALTADGTVAVTAGPAPLPGLLGPAAHLAATAALHGDTLQVSRLQLDGRAVSLAAHGNFGKTLDVAWQAALPDIGAVAPAVQGEVRAQGIVRGAPENFSVEADATGNLATAQVPRGPVRLSLKLHGLPDRPGGTLAAAGSLDGAPLALDATAERQADGTLTLGIARAGWKSLQAHGTLALAPASAMPAGRIALRMARLADLSSLLGQPVGGALTAEIATSGREARLTATVRNAVLAGSVAATTATLDLRVKDPLAATPDVAGSLDLAGLKVGGLGGTARLEANGPPAALALRLRGALTGAGTSPLAASAAARLDLPGRTLAIAALQADWQGETLRLLAPARLDFASGLRIDRLRLGVREAVLELAGRLAPSLDLTIALRNLPAGLARAHATGIVRADARLTGPPDRPDGRLHLLATGLHLRDGPATMLPAATLAADATLARGGARLTAKLSAGRNELAVAGTAPLGLAGAMDLHATGSADLAVLDPLLGGAGRQARGQVTLDATVTGSPAQPRAGGTLHLANGDVQDVVEGIHITGIDALLAGNGDQLRLVHLTGHAGPGSIAASGTIGLAGALPVELSIAGKGARLLASDLLTTSVDLDLALRGNLLEQPALSGVVTVDRADIRVPERLPPKIRTLDVRRPGQVAAPPAAAGPNVTLAVTLRAPGQVFLRGRGLDAELLGRLGLAGSTTALQASGHFTLRRGSFNLAGQTLVFTGGEIGFDGGNVLDPTLNLTATSTTSAVTATLTVTGTASAPKITLSSVPDLPQDEILAQLLFHQGASGLSGFQLAQAAAALAQISGIGGGFDPLGSIRKHLGLDRLTVGSAPIGNGATLEAGHYVAPGIYVGAKQGSSGNATQATVQVDLMRHLKLQATAGTGGSQSATGAAATQDPYGTGIGLTYQFDY